MPATQVKREDFLSRLEQVQPGLAVREIADQATCFAFKDGKVYTYNEFVACQAKSMMPEQFTGAVQSRPLLDFLKNIADKELRLSNSGGLLKLEGERMRCRIKMQPEVRLPIGKVKMPEKWHKLPDLFCDAARLASQVVYKNDANPVFTSVHIHPKWIEAATSTQCIRYYIETGVEEPILVRGRAIRNVADLGATKFALTDDWMHFMTGDKMILSCRRSHEKYQARNNSVSAVIQDVIKKKGKLTKLPAGLEKAVKAAKTFTNESDDKLVKVIVKKDLLRVLAYGLSGDFFKNWTIKYDGPKMKFLIQPDILEEIAHNHDSVELSKDTMRVKDEKWTYVASLDKPKKAVVEDDGYREEGGDDGDDDE